MSRYDDFRAPYGGGGGGPGGGGGGGGGGGAVRWDTERFTRERERDRFAPQRGPPVLEREPPPFARRPEPPFAERRAPGRFEETYFAEEKYGPPARRPGRYYEEEEQVYQRSPRGPPAGAMVPYDRPLRDDYDFPGGRRPGLLRRQSSLDTFDRRPARRFNDFEREEVRREEIRREPIPVPLPPRGRGPETIERDFEDIRIAEPDYYGDEEFRNYREREWTTRRVSRPRDSGRISPQGSETFEEVVEEKPFPRRGKTRMPRRMVHTRAIIELGYPFEEEGETIIILKALGKENIDEVVRLSREIKENEIRELESKEITRTTYLIEGPPGDIIIPPEETIIKERIVSSSPPNEVPRSVREWDMLKVETRDRSPGGRSRRTSRSRRRSSHGRRESIVEKTEIKEVKEIREVSPSRTVRSSRSRRRSSPVVIERRETREVIEDDRESSSTFHAGPLAIVAPERTRSKTDREIHAEIRRLEAERKLLRDERRTNRRIRESGETELIIEREPVEVVEVRKDRRAPDPRIIKAMMKTLT